MRRGGDATATIRFSCQSNGLLTLRSVDKLELNPFRIQHLFARMFEIDRSLAVDGRLHLARAPVGAAGVAHQHAGVQNGANSLFPEVTHG